MSTPRPGSPQTRGTNPRVSDARRQVVERARQSWIRKLIDLSRRNNLLYFRPLKTGTLDLSDADAEKMAELLSGESVAASKLLPSVRDEQTANTLRDIGRRALANAEEKGLNTLFLALGMATWPALDGGRPAEASVLLVPMTLDAKSHGTQSVHLTRNGAIQVNLVLLHVLETQFGVKLAGEDLISRLLGDDEGEPFNPQPVYDELAQRAADINGFAIKPTAILGNFAFQKMAMVKDLQERAEELAAHEIVAAIAGDTDARTSVGTSQVDVDPKDLDRTPPESEFTVLDADSSQQCAIAGVMAGQSTVIHGPPGTGKSQTIANLITNLAAAGKRVLFVAEKRAALDVVQRRLNDLGLAHLAIDLHGADLSSKKVMQQVARTLQVVRSSVPVDCAKTHAQLIDRRGRLNAHVRRMHDRREPTGKSIYEMQGILLRLNATAATRWRGAELLRLTPVIAQQIQDLLLEAGGFAPLFLRVDPSPWTGANLPNGDSLQRSLDLVKQLSEQVLPAFMASLQELTSNAGLKWPVSLAQAAEIAELLRAMQQTLHEYSDELYQQDFDVLLRDLSPGKTGGIAAAWIWCTQSAYRRARRTAMRLRKSRGTNSAQLFSELTEAAIQLRKWQSLSSGPYMSNSAEIAGAHLQCLKEMISGVKSLADILPSRHLMNLSVDDFAVLVWALINDKQTPFVIPKLTQIENGLEKAGAGSIIAEIRTKKPNVQEWPTMFEFAWVASTLDAVSQQDPEIRGFKGITHNSYVDDFTRLDEERISLAADRVRRAHGERAIGAMNSLPAQEQLIRGEASKTRRHLPLRKVFAQAAEVLTAVCPCWMASPLSVSQLLDGGRQYFDFVVFDEASQVLPEDAVPAILRGQRVVVAGDNKQLPPTTFFAAGDDEEYAAEEDAGASEGFESLLDMMIPFVRQSYLDWHYRSRDESLINFSNHHIYQNRLVTFPGPGGPPAINHVLVSQELGVDGQEESATKEVLNVVSLVIEYAKNFPNTSLGVITMGIRHMDRLQAALDRELERHSDLNGFFDPNRSERFFIKNLERVQGDERDAIIISIGYGKDRAGNLPLRFGPLLSEGGRRRLNVAVTRARQKLTVVSSFSHNDIDLARLRKGSGVELLRDYLQYASSQGTLLGDTEISGVPPNDFEAEVFDVLTGQGLTLIPQLGASRFRIDLVARHPKKTGRFVLAIECDGASYHSSYTARDRDRLRQQQLENLGWRFHRIWSTDWFMRKEEEVKRALTAFREAVDFADKLDHVGKSNHNGNSHSASSPTNRSTGRGPRPDVPPRPSIAQYSQSELVLLVQWISSDGQLRTDEQIISEMVSTLGFNRRGVRIDASIRNAVQSWRTAGAKAP